jgi:hypothetical protein
VRKAAGLIAVAIIVVTAACSSGGSGGGSVDDFCAELTKDNAIFKNLGSEASDSEQAIQLFDGLAKKAPNEIKGSMQTLLDFLKKSIADASALSADPSASRQSSHSSAIAASSSALNDASDAVAHFATDKCHIDLGGASSSSKFSAVGSSISN